MFIWGVWKERNCRVWENKVTQAHDVALMTTLRLLDFFVFHNSTGDTNSSGRQTCIKWLPPSAGWLKVNIDGAFDYHTKQGGWGLLVRGSSGQFLGGFG